MHGFLLSRQSKLNKRPAFQSFFVLENKDTCVVRYYDVQIEFNRQSINPANVLLQTLSFKKLPKKWVCPTLPIIHWLWLVGKHTGQKRNPCNSNFKLLFSVFKRQNFQTSTKSYGHGDLERSSDSAWAAFQRTFLSKEILDFWYRERLKVVSKRRNAGLSIVS